MRQTSFVSRVLMTVLVLTAACSTDSTESGAQLSLVIGNTDVRSVEYDIVCDGGATFSDEFEVVDDRDPPVWETFVGLPAGETCVITLTARDGAGNAICVGSTSVDILEGQTVKANIVMECPTTGEVGTGSVEIDGRFEDVVVDICPTIHILNAIPRVMTVPPGETSLRVQATDPDTGGDAATVLSSTSGDIADPAAKNTPFTCTQAGLVEVTVTAAAGDPNCEQRMTITLTCPGTGGNCDGVECDPTGNECTTASCNDATGLCDVIDPVADDTPCTGGTCQNGGCVSSDPCAGFVCNDDGNECTSDECADGICPYAPVADGTPCTGGTCQGGNCEASAPCADSATRCSDGDACTTDLCNNVTGECSWEPVVCGPTGNECTTNTCDQAAGCGVSNVADDTPCTGGTCQVGECVPSDPCAGFVCNDDGNECTSDECADGLCPYTPVADGTPCTDGTCQAGICEPTQGGLCADAATRCDDQNDCTVDGCNDDTGECTKQDAPFLTPCVDSNGWEGTCAFAGICASEDPCFIATTPGGRCDQGDPCRINLCDSGTPEAPGTGACSWAPNTGAACGALGDGICSSTGVCQGATSL